MKIKAPHRKQLLSPVKARMRAALALDFHSFSTPA